MADMIVCEVLCFVAKNYKRLDKSSLIDIIAKFYHEDELYGAKVELNKYVSSLLDGSDGSSPMVVDGWAKVVNKQGQPIIRKSGDASLKRCADADDIMYMMAALDVNKVPLPRFVAEDLDRIPAVAGLQCRSLDCVSPTAVTQLSNTVEELSKRLESMETRVLHRISELDTFPPLPSTSATPSTTATHVPSAVSYKDSRSHDATTASRSWAEQATDLSLAGMKPSVRLRGKCQNNTVKAVPRRLTCFVGRLASDVTEDGLTGLLKEQGILDAQCKKIVPRNGRSFSTSAFRVSCSVAFESIFYNESSWPEGAELRDWIFYNRNNG